MQIGWLLLAMAVAGATRLDGQQIRARSELVLASGYLWRGITLHRYPVAQPFIGIERNTRRFDVGLSGWASGIWDTGRCGPPSCSEGRGPRLADVNGSLLARFLMGNTQIAAGANVYRFNHAPFEISGASATTVELVGSVYAVPDRHIQLALTTWWDISKVEGLYAELSGTLPLVLRKSQTPQVFITATGGWNWGQHTDGGQERGYFQKNGLTHVSVEASWLAFHPAPNKRGTTIQLFVRLQGNLDPATKRRVWPLGDKEADQQFIFGFAVHPLFAHPPKRAPDM
jgi:hypothetical protein